MNCHICGNEMPVTCSSCPFCRAVPEKTADQTPKRFSHKTVNLEYGRPVVEVAMNRCREVINDALLHRISVITFIHGYGSSGKGGAIRSECRRTLDFLHSKKIISDYIAGEDFHKKSGRVRALLQRFPELARDKNLNQGNQGITLVILSFLVLYCQQFVSLSVFPATCLS